jgi:hypothetical protein
VRLQWTASTTPGAWYWVEYRDAELGQAWQRLPLPLTGATVFDFAGLPGNNHEFRIRSNNAGGDSPPSNVVSARPLPPAAPTGLIATPGVAKIDLRWTASTTPNVWYLVEYRDATIGQDWQRIQLPVTTGTSFTMDYLNGNRYEFRVRSTASSGESVPSNVVAATPLPPAPPSGLTATAQPNQVYLRWNASSTPNVWYWVEYRDADANGDWQRVGLPVPGGTSFTMTALWDHNYQFRIRSTGLSGESAPSNVAGAKPLPPLPPSGLVATAGDGHVWLQWNPSPTPNVWYWVYYRDVTFSSQAPWVPVLSTTNSFDARYLWDGHFYEFKVTATAMSGESGSTNIAWARPMPPPPQPPSGTVVYPQELGILVGWNPSPTPWVHYRIYGRDASVNGGWAVYGEAARSPFIAWGLQPGHTYELCVKAVDGLGQESACSRVASTQPWPTSTRWEWNWWGYEVHMSRSATRSFAIVADLVSQGGAGCSLFGFLGVPGEVISLFCDVLAESYAWMANSARDYIARGNCATFNVFWVGVAWVNEDRYGTENCY